MPPSPHQRLVAAAIIGWAAIFALAVYAAIADAGTRITDDRLAPYQAWADASLVPTPPGDVRLQFTGCLSVWGDPPTEVFWSCATESGISLAPEDHASQAGFLHELGHMFDFRVLQPRHRRLFTRWYGGGLWEPGPDPQQLAMGRELFASAYSLCARFRTLPADPETQYGWHPTQAEHDRACWLIRRAAARKAARRG